MKGLVVSQVKVQSFHAHFKRQQCKMFDTPELRALVRSGFFFFLFYLKEASEYFYPLADFTDCNIKRCAKVTAYINTAILLHAYLI